MGPTNGGVSITPEGIAKKQQADATNVEKPHVSSSAPAILISPIELEAVSSSFVAAFGVSAHPTSGPASLLAGALCSWVGRTTQLETVGCG